VKNVALLKRDLSRAQVPPTYIAPNVELGPGMTGGLSVPYRNPLFTFMLFVDGDDFSLDHVREIYSLKPAAELPNVVCFLNKGIVVNMRFTVSAPGAARKWPSLNLLPEFHQPAAGEMDRWAFVPLGTEDHPLAASLAVLYFSLVTHLSSCILHKPDLLAYLNPVISGSCSGRIDVLDYQTPASQ
jgi:hypothetical protein